MDLADEGRRTTDFGLQAGPVALHGLGAVGGQPSKIQAGVRPPGESASAGREQHVGPGQVDSQMLAPCVERLG